MAHAVFDHLFVALDRDADSTLSAQELVTGVAMLNQVNEFGKVLARLLQAASASTNGDDSRTLTRDRWADYVSRTAYDHGTLEAFQAVVLRLCPDPKAFSRSWEPPPPPPPRPSEAPMGAPPDTTRLPPGFIAVPSQSEPGQTRFFDPVSSIKYANLALAWQAYEHAQAQRSEPQQWQQPNGRQSIAQLPPRSPRASVEPQQAPGTISPPPWKEQQTPAIGSKAPVPTVQLQPLPTEQQYAMPQQSPPANKYGLEGAVDHRGYNERRDSPDGDHRASLPGVSGGSSKWSEAMFGPRKLTELPLPMVYTGTTRNWENIRRVDVPGFGPVEGATSLARLLLPRLRTSQTKGWDSSDNAEMAMLSQFANKTTL
mmetsp:Transcript_5764/g.13677  ORF Transcript_5764/g.13677 Transcript_5764/m.13677 type:complete len:370 (-) Transcript_5764:9-1118(-)